MTSHSHHTSRIAKALQKVVSWRWVSMPVDMNPHHFADIGFSQSDIIALHTR